MPVLWHKYIYIVYNLYTTLHIKSLLKFSNSFDSNTFSHLAINSNTISLFNSNRFLQTAYAWTQTQFIYVATQLHLHSQLRSNPFILIAFHGHGFSQLKYLYRLTFTSSILEETISLTSLLLCSRWILKEMRIVLSDAMAVIVSI